MQPGHGDKVCSCGGHSAKWGANKLRGTILPSPWKKMVAEIEQLQSAFEEFLLPGYECPLWGTDA